MMSKEMREVVHIYFSFAGKPTPYTEKRRQRLAVASQVLGRNITTFKELSDADYELLQQTFLPDWKPGQRVKFDQPAMQQLRWLMHHIPETAVES
jgi:hypothetical protein